MTTDATLPEHLSPRQRELLTVVAHQGFSSVETLAQHFGVSTQTVRRDIGVLCEANLLQRFHGGAGLAEGAVRLGYAKKSIRNLEAKRRIAQAVAERIPDGSSVFLDVGTTVEAVARALLSRQSLSVFTCSMAAAAVFIGHQSSEVFVTGGVLRGADGSLVGQPAVDAVNHFKVEYVVLGLSGLDEDGTLMDFDLEKVALKKAMMRNARTVMLAMDATKFSRNAVVRVAPPSALDVLFTDAPPPKRVAEALQRAKVEVVVAD